MKKLIAAILLLFAWPATAADVNGYTSLYECRSGGPNCNVDVATLAAQTCQQTITTATAPTNNWSAINWSNNVICIDKGDHTGRGTLTLGSSGTSGTRKVLRYYRSGDTDDEPWNQSGANQAKIRRIVVDGYNYWVIHRLSVLQTQSPLAIEVGSTSASNIILNRLLVDGQQVGGSDDGLIRLSETSSSNNNVLQNSVVRECLASTGADSAAVKFGGGSNIYIVNNELYNCTKPVFNWQNNEIAGFVVENNDIYMNSDYYTDCSGGDDPNGDCSKGENGISLKSSGTSGNPGKIIHNRLWGVRPSDASVCCGGGGTQGDIIDLYSTDPGNPGGSGVDWVLIQNNIVFDGQKGYLNSGNGTSVRNDNISLIGNIFYKFKDFRPGEGYYSGAIFFNRSTAGEMYLNTVIDAQQTRWMDLGDDTNDDIRCNTVIASAGAPSALGSGTQRDYNVYYGTPDSGETNKLGNYTLNTRANSTGYSLNAIIRTTATAPADGTAGDFLYKVTTAGTSAGSPPSYTTTLGGTTTDGTMVVTAIRGPYSFKRKLRTVSAGETVYIPYARMHSTAPESLFCPSGFASRTGIGIDNTQP